MKVKAVIMQKTRQNKAVVLKAKQVKNGKFDVGDETYLLDPDRFMITNEYRLPFKIPLWRKEFATYYYREGDPKPLPCPLFGLDPEDPEMEITAEELKAIFTPWFYRTIAPAKATMQDQFGFYLLLGIAGGVAYLVYLVSQIQAKMTEVFGASP